MLQPQGLKHVPGQFRLDEFSVAFDSQGYPDRWSQLLNMLDLCPEGGRILPAPLNLDVVGTNVGNGIFV